MKQYENYNGRKNNRLDYFVSSFDKFVSENKNTDMKEVDFSSFLKETTSNRTLMNNISDANFFLEYIGLSKMNTKEIDKDKLIKTDCSGILHIDQYKLLLKQLTVHDDFGKRVNNRDRVLVQMAWWGFKTMEIAEIKRYDIEFVRSNMTKIKLPNGVIRTITDESFREDLELYLQDRHILQFHKNPTVEVPLLITDNLIAKVDNALSRNGCDSVNVLTNILKNALYNNYVEIDGINLVSLNNQSIFKSRIVYLLSLGYTGADIQKILSIKSQGFIWLKRLVPLIYKNRK